MENKTDVDVKAFKNSFICSIVVFLVLVFCTIYFKPGVKEFSLSNFSGRILNESVVMPGTFTINVPFEEALRWGEDAILSFGESGVELWKSDDFISGVFLCSFYGQASSAVYRYKVVIEDDIMTISSCISKGFIGSVFILSGIIFFIFLVLLLGNTEDK